jgi:hypothetical protein
LKEHYSFQEIVGKERRKRGLVLIEFPGTPQISRAAVLKVRPTEQQQG